MTGSIGRKGVDVRKEGGARRELKLVHCSCVANMAQCKTCLVFVWFSS